MSTSTPFGVVWMLDEWSYTNGFVITIVVPPSSKCDTINSSTVDLAGSGYIHGGGMSPLRSFDAAAPVNFDMCPVMTMVSPSAKSTGATVVIRVDPAVAVAAV